MVLNLEMKSLEGGKPLTVVDTFPEAVTSFVSSIPTVSLLIDHLPSAGMTTTTYRVKRKIMVCQ